MAAVATIPPHATTGLLGVFGGTKDGKPAYIDFPGKTANINPPATIPIVAEDMRFAEPKPSFKTHGYEFLQHKTVCTTEELEKGKSDPKINKYLYDVYMPEVANLLKGITGGTEVIPNEFRLRNQVQDGGDIIANKVGWGNVNVTHVDRDPTNAEVRLGTSLGEERAKELLSKYKCWASVNLWRPIGETVQKWPLCMVNTTKVPGWDYETHMTKVRNIGDPAEKERGEKTHETVLLPPSSEVPYIYQYASEMTPDEVLIFTSFHTDASKVVPHGAFWDNSSPQSAPARRSIEARCWVFWDEK